MLPELDVTGVGTGVGASAGDTIPYASEGRYEARSADVGPLGRRAIKDTPYSIAVIPQDLIVNNQVRTVNDALRYLPSVQVESRQGFDVSRPQSRGFEGSVVQNTRLDGLNIIGTTAIPIDNLQRIEVLNGLAGALYGPAAPAGVFNYVLKRPTDVPLARAIIAYDSPGIITSAADVGGRFGQDGAIGYRINVVKGVGESYVQDSFLDRSLISGAFDIHFDPDTVLELNASRYSFNQAGLPGGFTYGGGLYGNGRSTILPPAVDPTRAGYGQPGAGVNLTTETGLAKLKHRFNEDWDLVIGGLYQNADRGLYGITNALTNDAGAYSATKNFTQVPRFTIGSNLAYLNGHFDLFGMRNDLTIGTNGFSNDQYLYRNSIVTTLGSASIANPVVFPQKGLPANGGQYRSANVFQQSLITGDTLHFNEQWAVQGVLSTTWLTSTNYSSRGAITSTDTRNAALSPTASLIYTPTRQLTTYFTFADSLQQGDVATADASNANTILAPYRSRQYEVGAKYAVSEALLITLDGFRITRPLAFTNPATRIFEVQGTQRNFGIELFASGAVSPELSLLGGVTWLDPRLTGTGNVLTNNTLVVGVPRWRTAVAVDYHPLPVPGLGLTGALQYVTKRAATNYNNSYAAAYATVDLGVRYSTKALGTPMTFRFQVLNVSDTHYWGSIAPGNINGGSGADTAYLGTPRTFQLSMEVDL
ncbi:TonB-dependent receptor [Methylobacterium planeticum]|nr:TonB-dependent receptor [Methylobacterium planeticum]